MNKSEFGNPLDKDAFFDDKDKFIIKNKYINGFLSYKKLFSAKECHEIINFSQCDPVPESNKISKNIIGKANWLEDRLNKIAKQSNKLYYNFDISAIKEIFILKCETNTNINWQMDIGPDIASTRKITIISYLTESINYDGGKINFCLINPNKEYLEQEIGTVHLIPSFKPYFLENVTRGDIYILQAFMHGNSFC